LRPYWVDETIVTASPIPYLPTLGTELVLKGIFPVYVPASCASAADLNAVLASLSAGSLADQPDFKKCIFTASSS